MKNRTGSLLKYGLSFGVLTFLVWRTDMGRVATILKQAAPTWLGLAIGAYLLSVGAVAYRWKVLVAAQGIQMSFSRATSLYFIGNFFSNFLPTSIGGDAVRALSARADVGSRIDAFASVFMERFVGLFAIVMLALTGLLLIALGLEHTYIVPATLALFIAMLAIFAFLFSRRSVAYFKGHFHRITLFHIGERAARFHEILYQYRAQPKALSLNFAVSIGFQGLIVLMNVCAAKALHIRVDPLYFTVFVPVIGIVSMFPFSINALGFREGGYVFLFDRIGQPSFEALGLSLTLYGITVLSSLPGGLLFSLQRRPASRASHKPVSVPELSKDTAREQSGS
ncbi:MAG: flippase-like domain-containing protein [candidate division Zixibacteria bacterium]|nr:flippase-like domain-containing protein [candidate division Zixibacteria bacterium]